MLNRIFVVDSVTLSSTGTAVSSYVPFDQTTRKLPTQVVVKATGQGAYVRLSNDNSAATNVDVLVQGGDHVVLSVQGRRWVSVLSDGASSTVSVGALSTGVSGDAASLSLDFAGTGTLDPRVTFTRASTATFFNSAGVLTSAAANAPRFDYNPSTLAAQGLLIEEARTNFFTNASGASSGTIGTGTVSGPDNVSCRTFIPTAGAVSFPNITGPAQTFSLSLGQTVDWAWSGWIAAGPVGTLTLEPRFVFNISVGGLSSFIYAELQINTSSWTVRTKALGTGLTEVSAPTITLFKPGLYRVTWVVRYTQDATGRNNIAASIQARDTANSGTYTADGVSGFQYTLCQAETGSFPTSVIPTTTTALTRAADVASVNTLSPWYNSVGGTLYGESLRYALPAASTFPSIAEFDNGTTNRIGNYSTLVGGTNEYRAFVVDAGVAQADIGGVASRVTTGTVAKQAFAFAANDFALSVNGSSVFTDTAGTVPATVNRMSIGSSYIAANFNNGWIRRVVFYPRRLSNAELVSITS